jgi:hypothetical protein
MEGPLHAALRLCVMQCCNPQPEHKAHINSVDARRSFIRPAHRWPTTIDLSTIGVAVSWQDAADVLSHKLGNHLSP